MIKTIKEIVIKTFLITIIVSSLFFTLKQTTIGLAVIIGSGISILNFLLLAVILGKTKDKFLIKNFFKILFIAVLLYFALKSNFNIIGLFIGLSLYLIAVFLEGTKNVSDSRAN